MVTILLALIGLIVSTPMVLAADCFGGQGQSKYASYAWKLRAQICGSNACAQSDSINGNNQFCTLSIPADDGATIELQRGDPSGQYTNWYVPTLTSGRVVLIYVVMAGMRIS
jgi:hypothetical protein